MNTDGHKLYQTIMNNHAAKAKIAGAATPEECMEFIVELGEDLGLSVTREEVARFVQPPPDGELSDLELEMVVGGKDDGKGKHLVGRGRNFWTDFWNSYSDVIYGGSGDDTIEGLDGADGLYGQGGNDYIEGGKDHDCIYGGDGDDSIYGGTDTDSLWGDAGDDSIDGGAGDDSIYGGSVSDSLLGDAGYDSIDGGAGDDSIEGGSGNDSIFGGSGEDSIAGGAGDDTIYGGSYDDSIEGGAGNDTIYGGSGNDSMTGGYNHDVFVFGNNDGHDVITDFRVSEDRLLLRGVESVDDISVAQVGGNTFILYGDTRIELENVELTEDQVWSRVTSE